MHRSETHEIAEKRKKSHVFGSWRHSLNLSRRNAHPPCQSLAAHFLSRERCLKRFRERGCYALLALPVLVPDTGLVDPDTLDGDNALLGGEEPRVRGRIREEEPTYRAQSAPVRLRSVPGPRSQCQSRVPEGRGRGSSVPEQDRGCERGNACDDHQPVHYQCQQRQY